MPQITNGFRRGAAYWWRRTLSWQLPGVDPIPLVFSLWTKDLSIARHRAASMTAKSEVVRMSIYERLERDGLKPADVEAVMRSEMKEYQQRLRHEAATWRDNPKLLVNGSVDRDLMGYELIWQALAKCGVGDRWPTNVYAEDNFPAVSPEYRDLDYDSLLPLGLRDDVHADTVYRLRKLGIEPNDINMALAVETVLKARSQAAYEVRTGETSPHTPSRGREPVAPAPTVPVRLPPNTVSNPPLLHSIPEPAISANVEVWQVPHDWRTLTPTQVANRLIDSNPLMFEHRRNGKRALTQVGEQTLRQIRWAAWLLEMSMNPNGREGAVRPFYTFTLADLVELDKWFDRLPTNCGKSPKDTAAGATLNAIHDRALDRIENGEICSSIIGLDPLTTNKHIRKLRQIYDFAREAIPAMPEVRFEKFLVKDVKDARDRREAYTVAQGIELFSLPPFTGGQSVKNRLDPGAVIIHDALFFVLLIVWVSAHPPRWLGRTI